MPKLVSWQQYMALMSLMSTSFPLMEFHPVQQLSVKNRHLFYDGRPVAAVQLNVAIGMFLDWLQSLKRPCLLFAHNAKFFYAKHLQRALEKCNTITRFQEFVPGFCDTLPAFNTSQQKVL